MHSLSSVISLAALLALVSHGSASPIAADAAPLPPKPGHVFLDCSNAERVAITEALADVAKLAEHAVTTLTHTDYKKNNGYTHYFKDGDHDNALKGFEAVTKEGVRYNFHCVPKNECPVGSFAHTDPTPESFAVKPHVKGIRDITVCAQFLNDPRTKRKLPTNVQETKAYCEHKESKKLHDFEIGGHTLLHEITHLDTYGLVAGLPQEQEGAKPPVPAFEYHGTVDWKGITTAGNARTLKTSKAKVRPETYQNAESLAAAATEMLVMEICDLKNIDL
ncbi:MAG: hypothetical protein M1826_003191 [Phylliscum demangeonii]|nr:MAG: hypothetical protein M1826_003191 [Phylliscum demangeonii]